GDRVEEGRFRRGGDAFLAAAPLDLGNVADRVLYLIAERFGIDAGEDAPIDVDRDRGGDDVDLGATADDRRHGGVCEVGAQLHPGVGGGGDPRGRPPGRFGGGTAGRPPTAAPRRP